MKVQSSISFFILLIISIPLYGQTLLSVVQLSSSTLTSLNNDSMACLEAPSCVEKFLSAPQGPGSICSELGAEDAPLIQRTLSDGSRVLNPVAIDRCNNRRAKNLPQTHPDFNSMIEPISDPAKIARVQQTINDLKAAMISQISQNEPLSEGQRHLLRKLETMEVTFNGDDDACRAAPFNASYAQNLNVMNVCPLIAHQPPEAYAALLAHELGHLADPCNSYHDRYDFSDSIRENTGSQSGQRTVFAQRINECLSDVPQSERESFVNWATGNTRMYAQALIFYTREGSNERRSFADRLVACGIVNAPENAAPKTFEGNPYVEIASCVSERHLENGTRIGANSLIEEGSSCQTGSRQREIMADYIGSAITTRYLNSRPRIPAERSGALLNFYVAMQCASEEATSAYLSANDRMTIFLQQPEIQEALGCQGSDLPQMLCPIPESLR